MSYFYVLLKQFFFGKQCGSTGSNRISYESILLWLRLLPPVAWHVGLTGWHSSDAFRNHSKFVKNEKPIFQLSAF